MIPTAAQIIEQNERLTIEQFKLDKQASPETNDRVPRAVAMGMVGGVGLCFGGTALAINAGAVAQGSAGHYGVFLGGLAVGATVAAVAAWFTSDSVNEASSKLQQTNQQLDGLLDAASQRTDLPNKFSDLLLERRQEIKHSLVDRENLKEDAAIALAAGGAVGMLTQGPR